MLKLTDFFLLLCKHLWERKVDAEPEIKAVLQNSCT